MKVCLHLFAFHFDDIYLADKLNSKIMKKIVNLCLYFDEICFSQKIRIRNHEKNRQILFTFRRDSFFRRKFEFVIMKKFVKLCLHFDELYFTENPNSKNHEKSRETWFTFKQNSTERLSF